MPERLVIAYAMMGILAMAIIALLLYLRQRRKRRRLERRLYR